MNRNHSTKNFENVFLLLICFTIVFLGCKQNKKVGDVKLLINIPEIANKPPSEVEKILGKRIDSAPKKQDKSKDSQDYRDFNIENGTVSIEFVDNKAVRFIVKPVQALEKDEILLGCGFEVDEGKKIETEFPSILDWYGTFNNIEFEKVQIIRTDKEGQFDRLQAFVMDEKTKAEIEKQSKLAELAGKKPTVYSDGTVPSVKDYLVPILHDYGSAEYIEWSSLSVEEYLGQPCWTVRLKVRAKNSVGLYIVKDTKYYFRDGEVIASEGIK